MARIQYTRYQFQRPNLITKQDYDDIKKSIQTDPNYNPFPKTPGFFNKFKLELKIGSIGIGISVLMIWLRSVTTWVGFEIIEIIGVFGLFICISSAIFSGIPTSLSYLRYMEDHSDYYSTLKNIIKKSNDYNDFKQKMEKYLIARYGLSKDTLILRN